MLQQAYIGETPLFSWHYLSLSIEWHKEEEGSGKNDKLWRGAGGGGGGGGAGQKIPFCEWRTFWMTPYLFKK